MEKKEPNKVKGDNKKKEKNKIQCRKTQIIYSKKK